MGGLVLAAKSAAIDAIGVPGGYFTAGCVAG